VADVRLQILLTLALLPGCAASPRKGSTTESMELRRQIDSLRRQVEHDSRTIHDLENRALVCEDKLETAQVASGRSASTPRLPVQRKRKPLEDTPRPAPPPASDEGPIAMGDTGDEAPMWDDDVEIVYEGEAAKDDQPRRVIRIHESKDPVMVDETDTPAPRPARQPVVTPREAGGSGTDLDPMTVYKTSYAALGRGDHVTAVTGFKMFLDSWPDHDYADNSQYWLAETWYDMGDFKAALTEFRRVVQRYPLGNKAPDAMLKIGYCYAKLSDVEAARDVLAQVIEIHPTSDAARLAARKLEELGK
jgi:tol-pal system protein YbgF